MATAVAKPKRKKERVNRSYDENYKIKVVKEYLTTKMSLIGLANKYELYPQMIVRWKKALKGNSALKGLKKPKKVTKK